MPEGYVGPRQRSIASVVKETTVYRRLVWGVLLVVLFMKIYAVSAQEDGWRVETGGAVYGTALSDDGRVQVIGSRDGNVSAYDPDGNLLWQFTAESTVWSVATSVDGSRTAVASEDRHVYLLDGQGQTKWQFRSSDLWRDVAISPDGARVVASDENRDVYFLDGITGAVLWQQHLRDTADTVAILGTNPVSVVVGSRDSYLTTYDDTGAVSWQLRFANDVIDVAVTPDGTRAIVATLDGMISLVNGTNGATIWQTTPPKAIRCTPRNRNTCLRVDISKDGASLLVGALDVNVYVLDSVDGALILQQMLDSAITTVAISGNGDYLLFGSHDGQARSIGFATSATSFIAQQDIRRILLVSAAVGVILLVVSLALWVRHTAAGRNFWQTHSTRAKSMLLPLWRSRVSYWLILPTFCLLIVFNYYPAASGLYHAFTRWTPGIETQWIGLDNFQDLFNSTYFFMGIRNALTLVIATILKLAVPLLVAELIFHIRNKAVSHAMRTLFIIPLVLPTVVTILIWVNIYDPNIGLLNQGLEALGLQNLTRTWLGEHDTALASIITIGFPWVSPFALLIFYGGLVTIPEELFDAAKVDGATVWTRFTRIDIPMMSGQIRLLLILAFIGSLQEFQSIFLTTGGGPGNATYTPALELYYQATRFSNFGLASAMGAVLFLAILGGTILNLRSIRSQTEYTAS
jgi:ABC-type sugar transport system permease subunit/outer membrane protein assembly factor BamB